MKVWVLVETTRSGHLNRVVGVFDDPARALDAKHKAERQSAEWSYQLERSTFDNSYDGPG